MADKENNIIINKHFNKILKYIVICTIVALTSKWISTHKLSNYDIMIIAFSAGATYILLDLYTPSINVNNYAKEKIPTMESEIN